MEETKLVNTNTAPVLQVGTVLYATQYRKMHKFLVTRVTAKRAYIDAHPDDPEARAAEVEVTREASPVFYSYGLPDGEKTRGRWCWEQRGSSYNGRLTFYEDLPQFAAQMAEEQKRATAYSNARYIYDFFGHYGPTLIDEIADDLASMRALCEGYVEAKKARKQ